MEQPDHPTVNQGTAATPMNSFSDEVLYMGLTSGAHRHAVEDVHGHWTWKQIEDRVGEAEGLLRSLDLPARSRVVLVGPDSIWHHILLMACARSSLIFVPVNNRYASGDIAHVMRLVRPAVGLVGAGYEGTFDGTSASELERPLGPFRILTWDTSNTPDLAQLSTARTPILISLTSGSTAAPKPVLYSAQGEVAVARLHSALWRLNSEDVMLAVPPFSWIYGLATSNLTALMAGSRLVILERFSPALLCDRVEGSGVTIFMGVVTHFRILVEYCRATGRRPFGPELRMAVSGGERRDEEAFAEFEEMFGVPVLDLYASSEARPGFGYDPLLYARPVSGSCGRLIPGVEAKIEPDPRAPDSAGTLHLRSLGNYMGYFDPTQLVNREVTAEDWLEMGDFFQMTDGWGFVVGRGKDVIIRGGANVSPAEVEGVLARYPNVTEVAVVGVPSASHGESVAAAVVGQFNHQESPQHALSDHCHAKLARFKVPTEWLFVDRLPRNSNDKVDKGAVRELFRTRPEDLAVSGQAASQPCPTPP